LHLGPHFKHWSYCNQRYKKQNKKRKHLSCADLTWCSLNQARSIMVESTINSSWICTWVIFAESSETLCLSDASLSDEDCVIFLIFFRPKTDSKTAFIQRFLLSVIQLAIYLIDYREYIFTYFVPYSQLIH